MKVIKALIAIVSSCLFATAAHAGVPTTPTMALFTFTPDSALQSYNNLAQSFEAPLVDPVGVNFPLSNIAVPGNYNAGQINIVNDTYALAPLEAEFYFGGVSDMHFGQVAGSPDPFLTLNANDTVGTFHFGTYSVPQTYFAGNGGTLTISPVPEPSTWLMMIFGFGLIGFALRNRMGSMNLGAI